jgi:hypothetical protein
VKTQLLKTMARRRGKAKKRASRRNRKQNLDVVSFGFEPLRFRHRAGIAMNFISSGGEKANVKQTKSNA